VTSVNFPILPQDANGNDVDTPKADNTPVGVSVSSVQPIVTAITETPSTGDFNVGGTGTFALTINESVTVTGKPTLSLNDGGNATYDAAKSTSTSLVFDYTVTSTNSNVSSLVATALNIPGGVSIVDGNNDSLDTSLLGLIQTGPEITTSTPSPNPAPPSGTTAVMIMNNPGTGAYEIYDVGSNAILAAYSLGQVGAPWTFAGLGTFQAGDIGDMLLRNTSTGAFEAYYVSGNNIISATLVGTVGLDWILQGLAASMAPAIYQSCCCATPAAARSSCTTWLAAACCRAAQWPLSVTISRSRVSATSPRPLRPR
jgi:hypothetical protein